MSRPFYSLMEGADRAMQALVEGYRTRGRRFRWISRTAGLLLMAVAVTQLVPTLADESTPPANEEVIAAEVPVGETVVVLGGSDDTSAPRGDNSPVIEGQDGEIVYLNSESETATDETGSEVRVVSDQGINLRIPSVVKVDPRAVTALLPAISITPAETLLLCISGDGLRFDLANKGFVDDMVQDDLIIDGDLTGSLRISGGYQQLTSLMNGSGGLRIWSMNRVVSGKSTTFSLSALTGVSVQEELCGMEGTVRTLHIRALGLGMETKKSGVNLN